MDRQWHGHGEEKGGADEQPDADVSESLQSDLRRDEPGQHHDDDRRQDDRDQVGEEEEECAATFCVSTQLEENPGGRQRGNQRDSDRYPGERRTGARMGENVATGEPGGDRDAEVEQ